MKAIVLYEKGPAETFSIMELPEPTPGPQDIIVMMSFAGINHGDVIRRKRGIFPPGMQAPYVLGLEGAGVVADIGREVTNFCVGQRVAFLAEHGAYSQVVRIPQKQAFAIPEEVSDSVAAASTCVGLTAWHLKRLASLQAGNIVLVHGGGGGVGSTLIQLCKTQDVTVITTVGSDKKATYARTIGADCIINHKRSDFGDEVLKLTDGKGVQTIFDCIGRDVVDGNFKCLATGGHIVYYGSVSGHAEFPGDKVLNSAVRITGFVIFGMFHQPELWRRGVEGLLNALREGSLEMNIEECPMRDVVRAHQMLEKHEVSGKLVLDMK